ncbi:MAG: 50S ribosomal protein L38E [Promethearchaeota archaeon]|nr:MAG: 50S ribosomal protein L38E [Candidatus Lokiarchaeota archaeon]
MKMPKQITDEDTFLDLSERAIHCRVKRVKDSVKLKLRTKKYLYTYKTNPDNAERLLRNITCDVIEL